MLAIALAVALAIRMVASWPRAYDDIVIPAIVAVVLAISLPRRSA